MAASLLELFCKQNSKPTREIITSGQRKKGAIASGNIKPEHKAINLGCEINFFKKDMINPGVESKKESNVLSFLHKTSMVATNRQESLPLN